MAQAITPLILNAMMKLWKIIIAAGCLVFALPAAAIDVTGVYLFEDKSREMSFEQVREMEFELTSIEDLNFGAVYSAFWIRLEMSQIPQADYYLQSCYIQADELDVFIPEADGWRQVSSGDTRKFSARDVSHECYVFDLAKLSDTALYIRTYSGTLNRLPISLIQQSSFWKMQAKNQFGYGFYFAILISMIIYNLFLFLFTRDGAYFFYVGYLASIALFLAEMSGHSVMYLWPDDQTWADHTPIMFAALAVAFGSRYIALISNADMYAQGVAKLMWWAVPLAAVTIILTPMKGLAALVFLAVSLLFVLTLAAFAIISAARNKYRPGYVMVVAIAMMVPGAVIYFLQAVGFAEENWLSANILYVTSALEAMILSIALAYRIETLNAELEQQEKQVSSMRERFSRRLIKTADNERRALARELHDGLGQGLLAVKNLLSRLDSGEQRDQAVEQVRSLITDSRNLARNMHPQQIENLGFATALETMLIETIRPAGIELELNLQSLEGSLNHDIELQLYRIAQECASNIVRHSRASRAEVSLTVDEKAIMMMICDDGVGIDQQEEQGIGLFNIQERAAIIGAHFEIQANSPRGTVVRVTLNLL